MIQLWVSAHSDQGTYFPHWQRGNQLYSRQPTNGSALSSPPAAPTRSRLPKPTQRSAYDVHDGLATSTIEATWDLSIWQTRVQTLPGS